MSEQQKQSTTPEVTAQEVKHALLNELEQQKQVVIQLSDEELEEVAGGMHLENWHKSVLSVAGVLLTYKMFTGGSSSSAAASASASAAAAGGTAAAGQ